MSGYKRQPILTHRHEAALARGGSNGELRPDKTNPHDLSGRCRDRTRARGPFPRAAPTLWIRVRPSPRKRSRPPKLVISRARLNYFRQALGLRPDGTPASRYASRAHERARQPLKRDALSARWKTTQPWGLKTDTREEGPSGYYQIHCGAPPNGGPSVQSSPTTPGPSAHPQSSQRSTNRDFSPKVSLGTIPGNRAGPTSAMFTAAVFSHARRRLARRQR